MAWLGLIMQILSLVMLIHLSCHCHYKHAPYLPIHWEKFPGSMLSYQMNILKHVALANTLFIPKSWTWSVIGVLHDVQWGSWPKRRAPDAALQKQLQYELTHAFHKQLITLELDAWACYDRIITTAAMLICHIHRLPTNACDFQKQMLDNASFEIKTSLGVSNEAFKNSSTTPINGNG